MSLSPICLSSGSARRQWKRLRRRRLRLDIWTRTDPLSRRRPRRRPQRMTQGMPNFTVDWHSHNISHWRRILERYRGQVGVRVLEIGSYEGRSTVWLLENILTHETAHI